MIDFNLLTHHPRQFRLEGSWFRLKINALAQRPLGKKQHIPPDCSQHCHDPIIIILCYCITMLDHYYHFRDCHYYPYDCQYHNLARTNIDHSSAIIIIIIIIIHCRRQGGLFATFGEKMGDPLTKESFTTSNSIVFPPKVAKRPPWSKDLLQWAERPRKAAGQPGSLDQSSNPRLSAIVWSHLTFDLPGFACYPGCSHIPTKMLRRC